MRASLSFQPGRDGDLKAVLEEFVNTYPTQRQLYQTELDRANTDFSPALLVTSLLSLVDKG